MDSTKNLIKNYLKTNGILDIKKESQLIALTKLVSNITYGEGRTIEEVLKIKKIGTCTGKHLVLQACFEELGIKYIHVVCTFRWGDQSIKYPQNLRSILKEGEWEHGHNFVQIKKDGINFDVDITWNPGLKPYGFKTFPESWDGQSSFISVDKIVRRWDNVDVSDMKKQLMDSLSPEIRERRERFLNEFFKWIEAINK